MTMVSELVLTRNQLLEIAASAMTVDFKSPLQRLSHITAELQDGVMQTRMQPIGSAWTKLSRVVRDLSEELGKKIELIQSGAETEIDRQLLEMIKDPLLHMVRNAADHGLEMPEERVAAGKPAHGTIHLRAAQESGYIIVEVTDDGRGIDLDRVKAKAVRNGLTTEADIARMSDEQVLRFVMEPGFSTAAAVTNISGRGVGLDVVRSHVEQVGGIVDLRSRIGRGLTVTIKLPLTLAIASALIVEAAGQRFAIPQISVAEWSGRRNPARCESKPSTVRPHCGSASGCCRSLMLRMCSISAARTSRAPPKTAGRGVPCGRPSLRHHRRFDPPHRGNRGEADFFQAPAHVCLFGCHHSG